MPGRHTAAIILAAGAATRFGTPKQLARIKGEALLGRVLHAASTSERLDEIVVVLGHRATEIEASVELGRARALVCGDWRSGISASIACGISEVADADVAIILLGDQPGVSRVLIARVLDSLGAGDLAARAVYSGRPGHPVAVRRELFDKLRRLRGDNGARDVLRAAGVRGVESADLASGADVDTVEDLRRIAAETSD